MAKYYISQLDKQLVADSENKEAAAHKFFDYWHARGLPAVDGPVLVNERGFPNPNAFSVNTDEIVIVSTH